jgi:hypothetical protein
VREVTVASQRGSGSPTSKYSWLVTRPYPGARTELIQQGSITMPAIHDCPL